MILLSARIRGMSHHNWPECSILELSVFFQSAGQRKQVALVEKEIDFFFEELFFKLPLCCVFCLFVCFNGAPNIPILISGQKQSLDKLTVGFVAISLHKAQPVFPSGITELQSG